MTSDWVAQGDWALILPKMQYDNMLAIKTSIETGLRIGDVVALPRAALSGTTIKYTASKTGKSGTKQISADLAKRLCKIAAGEWLFPGRKEGTHRTRQAVWRDVKQVAASMGMNAQISPHSARKTYAVELYNKRGLPAVQRELQHSRAETSMLYAFSAAAPTARADNRDMYEVMAAMADALFEQIMEQLKRLAFEDDSPSGSQLKALDMLCTLRGYYEHPPDDSGVKPLADVIREAYARRMELEADD